MWAVILAVQLEMLFFQALTVNTIGVLDLQSKQLGHIIKREQLTNMKFFRDSSTWDSADVNKNPGQAGVLPVGTDNPRKQSYK